MKTTKLKIHLLAFALLFGAAGATFTGCGKNYDDDIRQLQENMTQGDQGLLAKITKLSQDITLELQALEDYVDTENGAQDDEIDQLILDLTALQGEVTALELKLTLDRKGDSTMFANDIKALQQALADLDDKYAGQVARLEGRIDSIVGALGQIDAHLIVIDDTITKITLWLEQLDLTDAAIRAEMATMAAMMKADLDSAGQAEIQVAYDSITKVAVNLQNYINWASGQIGQLWAYLLVSGQGGLQDQLAAIKQSIIDSSFNAYTNAVADAVAAANLYTDGKVTLVEGLIADLKFKMDSINDIYKEYGRVIDSALTAHHDALETLATSVAQLTADVATNKGLIDSLADVTLRIEGRIDSLGDVVAKASDNIDSLSGVTTVINDQVKINRDSIAILQAALTAAEAQIAANKYSIDSLGDVHAGTKQFVDYLNSAYISPAVVQIWGTEAGPWGATTPTSILGRLTTIEADIVTINGRLDAIDTAITNLMKKITAVKYVPNTQNDPTVSIYFSTITPFQLTYRVTPAAAAAEIVSLWNAATGDKFDLSIVTNVVTKATAFDLFDITNVEAGSVAGEIVLTVAPASTAVFNHTLNYYDVALNITSTFADDIETENVRLNVTTPSQTLGFNKTSAGGAVTAKIFTNYSSNVTGATGYIYSQFINASPAYTFLPANTTGATNYYWAAPAAAFPINDFSVVSVGGSTDFTSKGLDVTKFAITVKPVSITSPSTMWAGGTAVTLMTGTTTATDLVAGNYVSGTTALLAGTADATLSFQNRYMVLELNVTYNGAAITDKYYVCVRFQ